MILRDHNIISLRFRLAYCDVQCSSMQAHKVHSMSAYIHQYGHESVPLLDAIVEQWPTCMQEAQAALLAKEDELAMLRRDLQEVTTRLQKQSPDSAAQPAAAQQSAAHRAAAEAKGQHSSPMKHDAKDVQRSRKAETAGVAESGLPSPSLPATPHSPVDSPPGKPWFHPACCALS